MGRCKSQKIRLAYKPSKVSARFLSYSLTMRLLLLLSIFSPLCLRLTTALAFPNDSIAPSEPSNIIPEPDVIENPPAPTVEDVKLGTTETPSQSEVQETSEVTSVGEPDVPETTEEEIEEAEAFDLSEFMGLLGNLQSSDQLDLSALASLFGNLQSSGNEGDDFSTLGALLESLQSSKEQDSTPPSHESLQAPGSSPPDLIFNNTESAPHTNEFLMMTLMKGLGPRIPTSRTDLASWFIKHFSKTDGKPDWDHLRKICYERALFKLWDEVEEKFKKNRQDLEPTIRAALGDMEWYLRETGVEGLKAFGPLLEAIRNMSDKEKVGACVACCAGGRPTACT
jgi:hypothetical protein